MAVQNPNSKLIYAFESDIKIDDDILKAELGMNGNIHLKNIIRTIQKEQNEIIRNTKDRIMILFKELPEVEKLRLHFIE